MKKQREKKKQKKKEEKLQRKQERQENSSGGSLEEMIAYVDESGNITSTPPDEQDTLARLQHRRLHHREVGRRVDDHAGTVRHLVTPDTRLDAVFEPGDVLVGVVRFAPRRFLKYAPTPLRPLSFPALLPLLPPPLSFGGRRHCAYARGLPRSDALRSPENGLLLPR